MSNLPKISIITSCYNHAHYLKETIDSVMNQTYQNIEMVVVNNGSSDNTDQVVQPYLNLSNFIYHKHEVNTSLGVARNNAIKISTGDWVFILDSDDIIEPNYLKNAVKLIENNFTVVFPKPEYFTVNSKIPKDHIGLSWQHPSPELKHMIFILSSHVSILANKELLSKTGLYLKERELQQISDWDMEIKLKKIGANLKMYNPNPKENARFLFRYEDNSMTRTNWVGNEDRYYKILQSELHADIFDKVLNDEFNILFGRNPLGIEKQIIANDNKIRHYLDFKSSAHKLNQITKAYNKILKRNPDINGLSFYYTQNIDNIEFILLKSEEYKKLL